MKVIVIIPAAGLGTRMSPAAKGKKSPSKQFTELGGTPILIHSLQRFAECAEVNEILIALRKEEIGGFRARLEKEFKSLASKVQVVEGGEHRQQSVANGLAAVKAAADDVILVHDAVRPLVTGEIIGEVIQAAKKFGAAIAGLPAVDTIKQVERTAEGAVITATIPREKVVMAQTPQGFRYEIIKKAFDAAAADGFVGTDEASLVEHSGGDVMVVMGSPSNIKITKPADLDLAGFYLENEGKHA